MKLLVGAGPDAILYGSRRAMAQAAAALILFASAQTYHAAAINIGDKKVGIRRQRRQTECNRKGVCPMSIGTILLIVLVLLLLGVIPAWPHARSWGYAPSGIVGLLLLVVLVLFVMGRL